MTTYESEIVEIKREDRATGIKVEIKVTVEHRGFSIARDLLDLAYNTAQQHLK
jgi:hypothetical protein